MRMIRVFGIGVLALWTASSWAISPVNLGTASGFAILAGSAVDNTGSSLINGNLGLSPLTSVTGFPPGTLNGVQYIAEGVALQAQNDLITAYNDAAGRTPVTTVATELGGTTLPAGVYNSASGTFGITGTLTLDGQNDANAVFVFQMEATLITASSSHVVLTRGAQACNVFWQVGSSATLGTYSGFIGNILALTTITGTTGVSMEGRVLARNGAVTLDTDTITVANCSMAADEQVILIPNNPVFPGEQSVSACADLVPNFVTQILVPVQVYQNEPTVAITSGCESCGDGDCQPLSSWVLGAWVFNPLTATYTANLTVGDSSAGGCVCAHLEFVLSVELLSFEGTPGDNEATLNWTTASETDASHFDVVRDGLKVTEVAATNNASGYSYQWTDGSVQNGTTYDYTLVAVNIDGVRQNLSHVSVTPTIDAGEITEYSLHQNFPNPFNPTTEIVFEMKEAGFVSLNVYNVLGQSVATLVNGSVDAGRHIVTFDAAHLPSGLYIYRMETNNFSSIHKMLLMK